MTIKDLVGKYKISGSSQDQDESYYKGILELKLDNNNRVIAHWIISNNQEQYGSGFFKDNILVINFNYTGDDSEIYNGVVVYKCITKDLLVGFWSEERGNPMFLGKETCFRIRIDKQLVNKH